ncbi:hypothetical protein RN607_00570 [Demequina capsici]|uniref:Uncharacterized protein n=1 Tax=Demequina capsici TaxID=3075620 RepID=A0AA96JD09_9MICO|nr:hypothetical protein [Demequina sp. PMTSA13]WNM27526.1 hypothetical protein RN607_00570 [Demequina sp. PMTSA13]
MTVNNRQAAQDAHEKLTEAETFLLNRIGHPRDEARLEVLAARFGREVKLDRNDSIARMADEIHELVDALRPKTFTLQLTPEFMAAAQQVHEQAHGVTVPELKIPVVSLVKEN